jgi:hypothetical protein
MKELIIVMLACIFLFFFNIAKMRWRKKKKKKKKFPVGGWFSNGVVRSALDRDLVQTLLRWFVRFSDAPL